MRAYDIKAAEMQHAISGPHHSCHSGSPSKPVQWHLHSAVLVSNAPSGGCHGCHTTLGSGGRLETANMPRAVLLHPTQNVMQSISHKGGCAALEGELWGHRTIGAGVLYTNTTAHRQQMWLCLDLEIKSKLMGTGVRQGAADAIPSGVGI